MLLFQLSKQCFLALCRVSEDEKIARAIRLREKIRLLSRGKFFLQEGSRNCENISCWYFLTGNRWNIQKSNIYAFSTGFWGRQWIKTRANLGKQKRKQKWNNFNTSLARQKWQNRINYEFGNFFLFRFCCFISNVFFEGGKWSETFLKFAGKCWKIEKLLALLSG